tara:strand:+ start:2628 stop:3077 length:450 start_codon:yes stop_codon:yes gene_type:complete
MSKEINLNVTANGDYKLTIDIDTCGHVELGREFANKVADLLDLHLLEEENPKSEANASIEEESTIEELSTEEMMKDFKIIALEGISDALKEAMKKVVNGQGTPELLNEWRENFAEEDRISELVKNGTPEEVKAGFMESFEEMKKVTGKQ